MNTYAKFEPEIRRDPPEAQSRRWIVGVIVLTIVLWGLAVALPVWETRSEQTGVWGDVRGIVPALLGWLGIVVLCPAWFANFLLFPLAYLLWKSRRGGFILSLIALAVAATAYRLPGIYGDNDEDVIMRRLIGFYLWLGCFVIMAVAHGVRALPANRKWLLTRLGLVCVVLLGIGALEVVCKVGVSPVERALRNPHDVTELTAALARKPSQAEKDSALWWAVRQDLANGGHDASARVTMLLAAGANPNWSERGHSSVLWHALSRRDDAPMIAALVKAGANVNARDDRGKTILEYATEVGVSSECQKILVDAGAHTNTPPAPTR